MTGISATSNDFSQFALPQAQAENGNRKRLGQEDFLSLLTTQLQNQDPLKPLDNNEFIAQMAQFSTVDGITTMNASIAQLSESFNANQALQAATMVGREVLTEDDSALLTGGAPLSGAVDMPYASPGAIVRIYSEAGELVGRVPLGPRNAGLANFSWNGTRTDGSAAPPGRYLISGAIESSAGDVPLATYAASRVQSVTLGGATGTQLSTDSGLQVRLSQVKAIR